MANKRKKFEDFEYPEQIASYLKGVFNRPHPPKKLYHYTNVQALNSIIDSGYLWLCSACSMNDYLESEFIKSSVKEGRLFLASFSKVEENLAMYKMYADKPNGVMLEISYSIAKEFLSNLDVSDAGKYIAYLVENKKITPTQIEADIYWTAVCYKNLHDSKLNAETVHNNRINNPFQVGELAGFVKLNGWEYEKEIRLCAEVNKPLKENQLLALKTPSNFIKTLSVILCPGFDKKQNRNLLANLKFHGILVKESEYESFVNLGPSYRPLDVDDLESIESNMVHIEPNDKGNTLVIDPRSALEKFDLYKRE